mgnify:CR=1 FL=1
MAKLDNQLKDNPKLEQVLLKDGRISLELLYYISRTQEPILDKYGEPVCYKSGKMLGKPKYKIKHNRKKERLGLYLIDKPRTPMERQQNKEILELAKKIRFEQEQQFKERTIGYRLKKSNEINFLDYFQNYIDNYTKKDIRMLNISFRRFRDFLHDTKKYSNFAESIKPDQLTKDMMLDFVEYLQKRSKGEGARSLFQRFKKVVNFAVEHDVMIKNPCNGLTIKVDNSVIKKDILSIEELKLLIDTHYLNENPEIRKAFIFSLYTGTRFCDVKSLKYKNIDYSNRLYKYEQEKTKGHSAASGVTMPLSNELLSLIGRSDDPDEYIFHLPSHTMCLKALRRWTKRAGIQKHITWHSARHSFATIVLSNGANIKTVASLLGHSGLQHTEKYVRAVDKLKEEAINSLPKIIF